MSEGAINVRQFHALDAVSYKAIREQLCLSADEFDTWVTGVYGAGSIYGYSVYFASNTPAPIREKVPGLTDKLFIHTGPLGE
jgi:hypothetical protein